MSRKPLIGLGLSIVVLLLLGGMYTNCQPIGDGLGNSSGDQPSVDVIPEDPNAPLTQGQDLWVNTVLPLLGDYNNPEADKCSRCHTFNFQGGNGNLNIYNYGLMRARASAGPTAINNPFINMPRGLLNHGGGNQCPGDINGSVSPCREISQWILAEFPLLTDGKAGVVTRTDLLGRISGWVADPLAIDTPVNAIFYLNGPVGIGVLAGQQLANLPGLGATNGLYYNFQLPVEYTDGVERDLYVYAVSAVADNLIPFMPVKTQGFVQSVVGEAPRDIYENELRPQLNRCMACHQVDYAVHWFQVGNPTPMNGGTPTNNELIDYMNGQNGHSGGSFCGGNKNNEPCASVQRWWASEFGP